MNSKSKIYCKAPSHSVVINHEGEIAPCCCYQGSQIHINDSDSDSLKPENLFSLYQNLNHIMKQEALPIGCRLCFKSESDGVLSKRQKLNKELGTVRKGFHRSHAEVNLSNTCNLDCIMCNTHFSSKWHSTHKKLTQIHSLELKNLHQYYLDSSKPYRLSKEKTIQLAQSLDSVAKIEILGGEPLLDKNFPLFVDTLGKNPTPPHSVDITTNLTTLNEDLIRLFQKNSHISFIFSVSTDGTNSIYEYIRGFQFKKLDQNIDNLLSHDFCTEVFIKPTFGFINATSYPDLVEWTLKKEHSKKLRVHATQFLQSTEPTSFIALTKTVRESYIEKLYNSPVYSIEKEAIETIVRHLKSFPEGQKENFIQAAEYIQVFNAHRGLDLLQLNPSLTYLKEYFQ